MHSFLGNPNRRLVARELGEQPKPIIALPTARGIPESVVLALRLNSRDTSRSEIYAVSLPISYDGAASFGYSTIETISLLVDADTHKHL